MENFKSLWTEEEHQLYSLISARKDLRHCSKDHITVSAFVLNCDATKILMIYHKKYRSWSWIGGHLEEQETLLEGVLRELREESGICGILPLSKFPLSLEKLWAFDHYHYNATYLFSISENQEVKLNERETEGISWIPIKKLHTFVTEDHMIPLYLHLYERSQKLYNKTPQENP